MLTQKMQEYIAKNPTKQNLFALEYLECNKLFWHKFFGKHFEIVEDGIKKDFVTYKLANSRSKKIYTEHIDRICQIIFHQFD